MRLLYDDFVITSFTRRGHILPLYQNIPDCSWLFHDSDQSSATLLSSVWHGAHFLAAKNIHVIYNKTFDHCIRKSYSLTHYTENTWPTNHAVVTTNHSQVKHPLTQTGILWSFACPPTQYEISMESLPCYIIHSSPSLQKVFMA